MNNVKRLIDQLFAVEKRLETVFIKWRNNLILKRIFRNIVNLICFNKKPGFKKIIKDNLFGCLLGRQNKNQALIGCCGLVYIDWIHRHADLSLYIGYDELYIDNIGFCEEAVDYSIKWI